MKKLPAETIYYIRCAVWELNSGLIFTSIWVLYFSVMGLSLLDVALIDIVITVSNLILEVPTGILADVYSRRLSVIVGGVFIGLAYVTMGVYPIFAVALVTGFVEAIGDTCVSGALQAWIADEVGTEQVGKVFLRGRQIAIPAYWAGIVLSIALAAWFNCQVPIVLGGAMWFALTIFLVLFMPETNFRRVDSATMPGRAALLRQFEPTLRLFADGVRLVRGSRIVMLLFVAQFFGMAFFSSFYKFSRANILQSFDLPVLTLPVLGALNENVWIGMREMLQGVFCLIGMEGVRRHIDLNQTGMAARVLIGVHILILVGLGVFAATGNLLLAMIAWLVVGGLQEIGSPITETWLNRHVPSGIRATVISMGSQVGALGQMGGSASLGAFGDRFGVRRALGLSGLFLVPILVLYARSVSWPRRHSQTD